MKPGKSSRFSTLYQYCYIFYKNITNYFYSTNIPNPSLFTQDMCTKKYPLWLYLGTDECYNGGNCTVDIFGQAECQCPKGYDGVQCETSKFKAFILQYKITTIIKRFQCYSWLSTMKHLLFL